ncbi:MAG: sulfatase [Alistipes sp.]|nr:sulfatase [Alistipes sp.]
MRKTLTLLAALPLAGGATAQEKPVNFIIINLDDAGYGDFSHNGAIGYQTPNIDRMAAEGMRLTHFLVAQPISGASRAGLLTGCYPNRIGFHGAPGPNSRYGVHPDEMNLGMLVKQKGYATAVFGKWHLGDAHRFMPLQNGFDEYYGLPYSNDMWPYHPQTSAYPDLPTIDGNEVVGYNTDQSCFTTDYTERSVAFIRRNADSPFLLYLAHSMPHVPLAVSDKFKGKSKQGLFGDVMMELDWSVGQILATLQELGLEENTLVILTSDNGPWINYGNHAGSTGGLREAKAATFDGGNRVPCVVYWKGTVPAGTASGSLVSSIDIFATIAEIGGFPLPKPTIDSRSFYRILKGDLMAKCRDDFAYYFNRNDLEAVTDGRFKLVFPHTHQSYEGYLPGNDGMPGYRGQATVTEPQLFDLRRDPGERYNVYEQYPYEVFELNAIADRYRNDLGDNLTDMPGVNVRPAGRTEDYK